MNMINVMSYGYEKCLDRFAILLVESSSETGHFRHLSDYVFGVRNFENTKAMRVIFFFQTVKIPARVQESSRKIEKKSFLSEIIASELVRLNCLY